MGNLYIIFENSPSSNEMTLIRTVIFNSPVGCKCGRILIVSLKVRKRMLRMDNG